jgi:hypothetical protein
MLRYAGFSHVCGRMLTFLLMAFAIAGQAATVRLAWDAPAGNTDGSAMTDLAGYRVYYGTASGLYDHEIDVGCTNAVEIPELDSGTTYYFSVTASNLASNESEFAGELEWCAPALETMDHIWSEAEAGVLTDRMMIASDSEASSSRYVYSDSEQEGAIELEFTVRGGTYVVWGLAAAGSLHPRDHDSFWVRMDDGPEDLWELHHDRSEAEAIGWSWDQVNRYANGVRTDPALFSLPPGRHILRFRAAESGGKIDMVLLTDDLSYMPDQTLPVNAGEDGVPPEAWNEVCFGTVSGEGTQPGDDPDDDGAVNVEEFLAGTDPTDPASRSVVMIDVLNGAPTVTFQARAAEGAGYSAMRRYYCLERSSNLVHGAWTPVPGYESIFATNQVAVYADTSGVSCAYYRTRISLR